jgi:hypothetical protein
MEIKEAIQLYGADAVFTASSAGACEDYEPLRAMGLLVDTIDAADQIGDAVYDSMTAEEKATLHWEASQDLYKPTTRMPEGLPTNREEQVALIESWLKMEQLRRGDLVD